MSPRFHSASHSPAAAASTAFRASRFAWMSDNTRARTKRQSIAVPPSHSVPHISLLRCGIEATTAQARDHTSANLFPLSVLIVGADASSLRV
jgi:hypothetical protein